MSNKVVFQAMLPNVRSAIEVSGNGDGGRVKLDVAQNDVGALLLLSQFQNQLFTVTVEGEGRIKPEDDQQGKQEPDANWE